MNEKNKPIEGRVASILNSRELVINVGKKDGVEEGMIFAVITGDPIEIRDPESEEILDNILREKVRVEAREVREKITICKTYRMTFSPSAASINLAMMNILKSFPQTETPETFKHSENATPPPIAKEDQYVKIKDRVVQVITSNEIDKRKKE